MSVIIRLQNLPWSANALDIRQFFHGLSIPEGGVHIVGGELGDAFIAFSTDEDARQAYLRNNGKIKEVQISLMLSSRTEMQKVIEAARAQSYAAFMHAAPAPAPPVVPLPAVVPPIVPAAVPEIKRDTKEKEKDRKDRRRSRSKSRDRRDRSRDRDRKDRRYRDRSTSRSRDRKSRSRRGRSRSKGRSNSKERDRRSRDRRKRSEERSNPPFPKDRKQSIDRWANANKKLDNNKPSNLNSGGPPIIVLDDPQQSHNNPNGTSQEQRNGFNPSNFQNDNSNSSENWQSKKMNNFGGRFNENFQQNEGALPNRFRNFGGRYRGDINPKQGCVAVEPFYGGYSDIRRFFNGLFISNRGIKFINDENGRKTGLVLVQFGGSTARCVEQALSLNGQNLNGINVSVTLINEDEFDAAVDRYVPSGNNPGGYEVPKFKNRNVTKQFNTKPNPEPEAIEKYTCLIVDELPNYCKEQDILHMFSQHPLVALILTPKKRGGHIAYVKFSSPDVAKKALEEKSLHFVSGKPVMVKPCKDDEFEEINKEHEVQMDTKDTKPEEEEEVKTDCISISQLPLKTIDKDIADFFSDVGVIPTKIHLMSNDLGFTGQAYCEFMSTADCSKAVKKNGTVLGPNTIKVVAIDRAEMLNILGQTIPAPEPVVQQEASANAMLSPNPFHPVNSFNPRMPNRPPFFNRFDGPTRGAMRFGPRGGNVGPPRQRFQQPQVDSDDVPPGCTVFLNNVPYKAGTAEILNLFEGFNHTHNVSRRYNANNKPSDEAKITFYDPEEATRAIHALNKAKIWDRMVFLRQE